MLPEYEVACESERQVLAEFLLWLVEYDPDVLIGWNVVNFDMWYLQRVADKHRIPFTLGRDARDAIWRTLDDEGERRQVLVPGRVVLFCIELLLSSSFRFYFYSL